MNNGLVRTSKFLSLILRHKPETVGLKLDEAGWVPVDELITACNAYGKTLTLELLRQVVLTNDKQRFSFNEDETLIRANQGHSVQIELGYEPKEPPETLFHGTATRFLDSIKEKGLIRGKRNHVHLSADYETALKVGGRHGKPIVLEIASRQMQGKGFKFFISENGVWLTEGVPVRYLSFQETPED